MDAGQSTPHPPYNNPPGGFLDLEFLLMPMPMWVCLSAAVTGGWGFPMCNFWAVQGGGYGGGNRCHGTSDPGAGTPDVTRVLLALG